MKIKIDKQQTKQKTFFQSNEVKNSYHMELEGLKRGLAFLKERNISISSLVTDRHAGIKKYLRENEGDIDHRFDCWHLSKSMFIYLHLLILINTVITKILSL